MEIEQWRMGKTLVNITAFPTTFGRGRSQGACCLYMCLYIDTHAKTK